MGLQKFGKVTDNNNSLTIWSWIVVAVTIVVQLLIVCVQISKFNKYTFMDNDSWINFSKNTYRENDNIFSLNQC